jgi:hypothetical protein
MTQANEPSRTTVPPALSDLLAGYLRQQAEAQAIGLAPADGGDVVPFEAAPVQPVDPKLAWSEATRVLDYLHLKPAPGLLSAPPDWSALVAAHEPAAAIAFCLGNYPQLVRNFQPLLHPDDLARLRPAAARPVPAAALQDWAVKTVRHKQYPLLLLALGALRLARQFDRAADLVRANRADVPAPWRDAWANEEAALAWHRGRAEEAASLWQAQPDSIPVHFNRGMAALFLDHPADARTELAHAVARLPEESGWHHLGCLYLALAEMRP